jgi:creatinine amidohydrolase
MENFPWTRLANVTLPDKQKPMSDLEALRQLEPRSVRDYLNDGNYGGRYQREDEEMMRIWQVGVAETRELLEGF